MNPDIAAMASCVLRGRRPTRADLLKVLRADGELHYDVLYWANRIRLAFKGKGVLSCSIVSAKQGLCGEDCHFCAQAARYRTGVKEFPLVPLDRIEKAAADADPDNQSIRSEPVVIHSDTWRHRPLFNRHHCP